MRFSLFCLLAAALLGAVPARTAPPRQPEFIPGRYIVVLAAPAGGLRAAAAGLSQRFQVPVGYVYHAALNGFSCSATPAQARALARQPGVAAVVPDLVVHASAQTVPTGVRRVKADDSAAPVPIDGVPDAPDIDIAIIDTGIGPHDDLRIAGGVDLTGAGTYADGNNHGTHVAGIAAALDNGDGVVGVCPGARLWAVRVLAADGSGPLSRVAAGVDWVADTTKHPPIEVANLSLTAYYPPIYDTLLGDPLRVAISNASAKGVHFAVAAGNDSADAANYIPARYDPVICTSALADSDGQPGGAGPATSFGPDDSLATFSNFGSKVDVIAPGVDIYSTLPNNGYGTFSGTSMASPHTAGAIADYLLAHPGSTPAQVLNVFKTSGEPAPPGGWRGDPDGVAERAINIPLLLAGVAPPPPPAPDFTVTVSTDRPSYRRGQLILITVRATTVDGSPVAGAPVTLTVTDPRGVSQSTGGTTNSTGQDVFLVGTSRQDALGTWTVRAQVTANGLTRQGTTTFQLRS